MTGTFQYQAYYTGFFKFMTWKKNIDIFVLKSDFNRKWCFKKQYTQILASLSAVEPSISGEVLVILFTSSQLKKRPFIK